MSAVYNGVTFSRLALALNAVVGLLQGYNYSPSLDLSMQEARLNSWFQAPHVFIPVSFSRKENVGL